VLIHELILEDRRISAKSIAEQLGISRERVGSIIHENFDMLVACFLPDQAKDLSVPLYPII
jgi:plasmid maintenance system antidote protein VapI